KTALRPIRFNNGRGYYFAVSLDGVEKLYPVAPQFENQNLLDLQDAKGNYVIRDEIKIIKTRGEGFVRDYWRKPGSSDEMIYPKITFVKYFEPLDWYFGTGEYIDNVEKDIQQESLVRLSRIRFGPSGYIFVNTNQGDALITDGEIVKEKRNLWDLSDPLGVKVIQEERKAVENPAGDFIHYSWRKMDGFEPEEKISFIKGFPQWKWMVGAGFYINDVTPEIENLREKIEKNIRKDIIKILIILLVLLVVIFIISRIVFYKTRKNFQIFLNFFQKAADESTRIDSELLSFTEFKILAESANEMIEKRLKAEQLLKKSEEKYRQVVTHQGEGIVILDLEKKIIFANPAAGAILEVEEKELENRNFNDFIIEQNDAKGESDFGVKVKTDKNRIKYLIITSTDKYDENGKKTGTFEIFRDITERKEFEREIKENREQLKLINKILRHDLTNNLAVVISALRIFAIKQDASLITEIKTKIDASIELIKRMQEFETISLKQQKLMIYDLRQILEKLVPEFPALEFSISGNGSVIADQALESIFSNLIGNAEKHSQTEKLEIAIYPEKGKCTVVLKDFGIGIPDNIKEKIFDESFTFGKTAGSGLGLFIVKKALESYEATIKVEDNSPQGTVFIIVFKSD
ncbi:MAG: cache domain-containing protein, partial [Candidatus Cloacimonetes bacterium]|nr:cache domain-containing protein [Candidatus Cloacimonadota bacterium]